jgi:RNA 2',3'-cyclic 3'-phosphodiesterase
MKRLFAAIKLSPDPGFIKQFHSLQENLRHEKIKWVEDHNIHITLKFFGETEERKIPEISRALQSVADKTPALELSLQKLGIFGSSYDPRVVWVGIEPYKKLADLMKLVQDEMRTAGYEPDRQNLVPHLTLGRIKFLKDKPLFQRLIDKNREISSEPFTAGEFHLYESILRKEGPLYVVQETFKFGGG